ncbi:MAG: triose-phosphate isomerase, partial [Victivallales bacterium]|nr:triose-phosphate isomerase [Victivallales bacterium]
MSKKVIIAGNWKMNKTASEARDFVEAFKPLVKDVEPGDVSVVVCPPFTGLSEAVKAAAGSNVKVGAQNIHWEKSGAFTGEISGAMLKELGVEYVIIGHSERRQYFGETDETVNKRLKAALDCGLVPIVCIGELLEERESNKTEKVLDRQLRAGLAGMTTEQMEKTVVAYEPVWAIGTGKTATPDMAQDTHAFIRSVITDMFGAAAGASVCILYGGSMNPSNSGDLIRREDVDGGLVG